MAGKPGPDPSATVPAMVDAIENAEKPAVTVGDIADALDVSNETIRRHRDELESHPDVSTAKVGRATAYWVEIEDRDKETVEESSPSVGPRQEQSVSDDDGGESGQRGILRRLFTSDGGMPLPGIVLVFLGVALPMIALRRGLDVAIDGLLNMADVYTNAPESIRYPRLGSPAAVWSMTFFSAMVGLVFGVALGILILDPLPVVAYYATTIVLGIGMAGSLVGVVHYWITKPAFGKVGETA